MKKTKEHVIKTIESGSIAEELELEPGCERPAGERRL